MEPPLPPDRLSELTEDVLAFIESQIDSVPHMEALLLLWESAPEGWTAEQVAARIYVRLDAAKQIVADLVRRRLVAIVSDDEGQRFAYDPTWDERNLMARVAASYRGNLIRVSHAIHAKASGAVREFARAFERKKDG
ncbi:MAG TPA: hypothetical protein VFY49_02255 [Myxococcota bacterium]|nr:hypothetical protein [Myxococcota bacterium]